MTTLRIEVRCATHQFELGGYHTAESYMAAVVLMPHAGKCARVLAYGYGYDRESAVRDAVEATRFERRKYRRSAVAQ